MCESLPYRFVEGRTLWYRDGPLDLAEADHPLLREHVAYARVCDAGEESVVYYTVVCDTGKITVICNTGLCLGVWVRRLTFASPQQESTHTHMWVVKACIELW